MIESSMPPTLAHHPAQSVPSIHSNNPHVKTGHHAHMNGNYHGNSYAHQELDNSHAKYDQTHIYQQRQGAMSFYNASISTDASMSIGYSVPTYPMHSSNELDATPYQYTNQNHHSPGEHPSSSMHMFDQRGRSSGLGLLVESATSSTYGRNDGTQNDAGNYFTVGFEISGGNAVSAANASNNGGNPSHGYLDHEDASNLARPYAYEETHVSPVHAFLRSKDSESLWRCGTMSPAGSMDNAGNAVHVSMISMAAPGNNTYASRVPPREMMHQNKHQPSRFQPSYSEPQNPNAMRQVQRSSHVNMSSDDQSSHYPMLGLSSKIMSTVNESGKVPEGLCTLCGSSHVQFMVEPCGHFYHAHCAASLHGKTQKICFCGQQIQKFRSLCPSHGLNSLFPLRFKDEKVDEHTAAAHGKSNGAHRMYASGTPDIESSDASMSFVACELLRAPDNVSGNHGSMSMNNCEAPHNSISGDHNLLQSASEENMMASALQDLKPTRREYRKLRTCAVEGCNRTIRSRGLCKAHGGGKRCDEPGCNLSDQGGGRCINHGGGKRCQVNDCKNSAQSRGLCKQHGGGSRCTHPGCSKSSQGYGRCRAHGGGRRCRVEGCEKTDRRGGYCVTHGADRKCSVMECMKTARMQGLCTNHYFEKHPAPAVTNGRNLMA